MKCIQIALRGVVVASALCLGIVTHAGDRRFTVADSISLSTFQNPISEYNIPASEVIFSPDSAHFVVVTVHGNLSSDKRVATMRLFDTAQVRAYVQRAGQPPLPRARMLVSCASASNQQPMSHWRWSSNGRSILFLCADDAGANHLERIALDGGGIVTISGAGQDVSGFDDDDGHVVYLARTRIGAEDLYQAGGPSLPDIEDGTGESLLNLVFPNWMKLISSVSEEPLYKVVHGMSVAVRSATYGRPIHLGGDAFYPYTAGPKLAVGANGGLLLATEYVQRIPRSWGRYRSAWFAAKSHPFVPDTSAKRSMVGFFRPQEYVLVNLENGKLSPLINAPLDWGPLFFNPVAGAWSPDESHLAVTGVFPPLQGTGVPLGGPSGVAPCAIAVIDLTTRQFSCTQSQATLEPSDIPLERRKRIISLAWSNSRVLIATYATENAPNRPAITRYSEDPAGRWHAQRESRSTQVDGLRVYVEQALNQPPVLMASLQGESAQILFDPNPQLKDIALGQASLYRWKDASGKLRTGALVTPPEFSRNRRYPLVIQTDPLDFAKFMIDGPSHTAFTARELAARDIVVLQVSDIGQSDTPGFMTENAANYRAAIRQLARSGVINPHRVGIIGWSHTGVFVLENLIDDPSAFKAASLAEASSSSYSEFLANVDYPSESVGQNYMFHYLGAWPWGDGLKVWLARSPGFHTDRICAPILYQENSAAGLVFLGWEDYAILRAQHKPVDLLYVRNGAHALIQPRERLVEQQMNVDWFDYWLNGHKSSHPAIAGEYQRWDAMRESLPVCPASDTN